MSKTSDVMHNMISNEGKSIYDYSINKDVLLVFLRHFGCTFCRESLEELSKLQLSGKLNNAQLILVHMSTEEIALKYFKRYNIWNAIHVSDHECRYYKQFGIMKGTFNQLFGFRLWFRGIEAGLIKGYGFGPQLGDGFQMPGVFLISKGKVIDSFIHKFASDKPDFNKMLQCGKSSVEASSN